MKRLITSVNLTADDRRRIEEAWPEEADECRVVVEDGFLCARFLKTHERFERIRRITGYLPGTLDKWNNAKRAEERDRVKHWTGLQDSQDSQEAKKENHVNPENHVILSKKETEAGREGEVEGAAADGARGGGVPCGDLAGGARRGPHVVEVGP